MSATTEVSGTKSYAVVAKQEFESFLQATAFKSLQFIKCSTHWIESVFWIVLLIGGTGLAIKDVRKVCEEYINEETQTSMQVSGLQNLTFEAAVVCVEYNFNALDISDPLLLHYANSSEILDLASRMNVSAVELLKGSLKLITTISLIEMGRMADYQRKLAEINHSDDFDVQRLKDELKLTKLNIYQLGSIVGDWLCNVLRVRIYSIKRGTLHSGVNPCDKTRISWVGVIPFVSMAMSYTTVCLDVGGLIFFDSMLDRVVVSVNTNENDFPTANYTNEYVISAYLDFSGDPVSTDMTRKYITFPTNQNACVAFVVGVDAKLRQIDRRLARCNTTAKTRMACYGGCDVLRYENTRQCNCTHLAWQYLYGAEKRKMCFDVLTIEEHMTCRHAHKHENASEACWQSCLYPCAQQQIGFAHGYDSCYEEGYRGGVSLELSPKQFTVTVFDEHLSPSNSELLSRIGGTCGLWLGVGILGLCHAILFPLKLLRKLFQHYFNVRHAPAPYIVELADPSKPQPA